MANPTVATYERMLERDLFKDPANAFGDDDMLTTKLKVGGTLGSEPNAVVARELDANVMGNIGNGHSLVLYALLQRAKGCVEKLLAFYPAPTCHPAISASVCVANVAHSPVLFRAAIVWGDAEVFNWLLNARQGFIMLANFSERVTWTTQVSLERQGLGSLLYVLSSNVQWVCQRVNTERLPPPRYNVCDKPVEMSAFVSALVTAKAEVAGVEGRRDLAIHAAAKQGHTEIVKVLLINGANVDAVNHMGQTPLHLAFRFGQRGTHVPLAAGNAAALVAGPDVFLYPVQRLLAHC